MLVAEKTRCHFPEGEILLTARVEWPLLNKGSLDLHHADQLGYAEGEWSCSLGEGLGRPVFAVHNCEKTFKFPTII